MTRRATIRSTSWRSPSEQSSTAIRLRGHGLPPPWLVDRLFRNLLIDATGNTHRAEFCIDKLYSPESASGRLGLLEMRAFEMPPHARMSLAQQLLLRTLIAKFWRQPYPNGLVRWGTDIHDRWMLPHFVLERFRRCHRRPARQRLPDEARLVRAALRIPLPANRRSRRNATSSWKSARRWSPGTCWARNRRRAARCATWIAQPGARAGESARPYGTRHVVTSAASRSRFHPTGTNGEYVAGVRYRAWQPPECLQPDHRCPYAAGLRPRGHLDKRSLGGCTYHVAHPGGRLHHFSCQRLRSGEPPPGPLLRARRDPGTFIPRRKPKPGLPLHLDLRRV